MILIFKNPSQSFPDNGTKTNVRFLMEDLLKKIPPDILFKSISLVMGSAAKESKYFFHFPLNYYCYSFLKILMKDTHLIIM